MEHMVANGAFQTIIPLNSLEKLEELAHNLSNCVGTTMNSLILAATAEQNHMFVHLAVATEQAMRATGTLQMLMWELANIRRLAQAQAHYPSPSK